MKILIAADTYYPQVNGASYFTQRLAQALASLGHTVGVVAPGTAFSFKKTSQGEVTFFELPSMPIPFLYNFRFTLPILTSYYVGKVIKMFHPDIVHIQMHFTVSRSTLSISRKNNIPVVATNHFMPENITHYFYLPRVIENIVNNIAWKDCARILSKTQGVTSPTKIASDLLAQHMSVPVISISNGIDIEKFFPRDNSVDFKSKYSLPETFVLFVGRLDKEKNIDVVIRAMLFVNNKEIHFVIAGDGNERKALEVMALKSTQERIHFLGFVPDDDLPILYAHAKCFINMGTAELQSIVTMEAMATHLPIIGAKAVALPDLIHNKENGVLVEPGDVEGVSNAINFIFEDEIKRKNMGEMSFGYVKEHDIKNIIKQYEDLYKQVTKKV